MKAKNIFRISFLALLLCMMTMLGAMADETASTPLDAKIIRWDGMGNVNVASYTLAHEQADLAIQETDGILRVTGGNDISNPTFDNCFNINLAEADYIDLTTYPYYIIKYKTNDAYEQGALKYTYKTYTEVLLHLTDAESNVTSTSYYHANPITDTNYDLKNMWRTYMFHIAENQTDVTNYIQLPSNTLVDGAKVFRIEIRPAKYIADTEIIKKLSMDIEYIAFFKTKEAAEAYSSRSSVEIRFDGSEDRAQLYATKGSITADKTFNVPMDMSTITGETTAFQPQFYLATQATGYAINYPNNRFTIKEYPYTLVTLKNSVTIPTLQLYYVNTGSWIHKAYYNKPIGEKSDSFKDIFINKSELANISQSGETAYVSSPFFQFKSFTAGQSTAIENTEIKYVAYFKTAEDRAAFLSGAMDEAKNNIKAAYKAVANARNGLTVENASQAQALVKSTVDSILADMSGVTATYAVDSTDSTKITVTLTATATKGEGEAQTSYTATKAVGFDVEVEKELDAKIISFGDNKVNNATLSGTCPGEVVGNSLRIDIPAEIAYASASSQPTFTLDNGFKLSEYPYVKIRMRTNYPKTIQFYALNNEGINYSVLSDAGLNDGKWHDVELYFNAANKGTDAWQSYTSVEGKNYTTAWKSANEDITKPFFQFKGLNNTPDGDLFAEIEFIAFFSSEADMKAYSEDDSKIIVGSAELKNNVFSENAIYVDTDVDDVFRIKTTASTTTVDIVDVIRTADGNKVDLYEYPYVNIRFRTNYAKQIQFYPINKEKDSSNGKWSDSFKWYSQISDSITADGTTWYNAMLSFNDADVNVFSAWIDTKNNNKAYPNNSIKFNNGYDWTVRPLWKDYELGYYPYPTTTGDFVFDDLKFQLKTGVQEDGFFDIDYIAFYKDKDTMLNDTAYKDYMAKIDSMINGVGSLSFNLHPAVGEFAIENYVKEAFENVAPYISVVANAVGFDRNADTCNVEITASYGPATKIVTVEVATPKLGEITLDTLGAQIRSESGSGESKVEAGLRFGTKFAYDKTQYTIVEYGTLLSPVGNTSVTEAMKFEKASVKADYYCGSRYIVENKVWTYFEAANVAVAGDKFYTFDGSDYQIFTAVLKEIPDGYQDEPIIARPYVTYTLVGNESGKEYTYYGTEITRSWKQVKDAVDAGNADTVVDTDSKWSND